MGGSDFLTKIFNGWGDSGFDIANAIIHSAKSLPGLYFALEVICGVIGFILVLLGLRLLVSDWTNQRGGLAARVGARIAVGVLLIHLTTVLASMTETIFADAKTLEQPYVGEILAYDNNAVQDATEQARLMVEAILAWIRFMGWVGLAYGVSRLVALADGRNDVSTGAAVTQIIGGVLAANIGRVIDTFANTFGWLT